MALARATRIETHAAIPVAVELDDPLAGGVGGGGHAGGARKPCGDGRHGGRRAGRRWETAARRGRGTAPGAPGSALMVHVTEGYSALGDIASRRTPRLAAAESHRPAITTPISTATTTTWPEEISSRNAAVEGGTSPLFLSDRSSISPLRALSSFRCA